MTKKQAILTKIIFETWASQKPLAIYDDHPVAVENLPYPHGAEIIVYLPIDEDWFKALQDAVAPRFRPINRDSYNHQVSKHLGTNYMAYALELVDCHVPLTEDQGNGFDTGRQMWRELKRTQEGRNE